MPDDEYAIIVRNNFLRQRRALIIWSLILLAAQLLKLKLDTINVFGNNFSIGDPAYVTKFLWIVYVYYVVRYYQYLRSHEEHSNVFGSFLNELYKKVGQFSCARLSKKILNEKQLHLKTYRGFIDMVKSKRDRYCEVDRFHMKATVSVSLIPENRDSISSANITVNVTSRELAIPKIRAAISLSFHTAYFTDYVLPLVIAFMPIILLVSRFFTSR